MLIIGLLLSLAACSRFGGGEGVNQPIDEIGDQVRVDPTTGPAESDDPSEPTASLGDSADTTVPPVDVELSEAVWVVNGYDGLIDDRGRALATLDGSPVSGGRSVARAVDGSLYFATEKGLWALPSGESQLVEVNPDPVEIEDLGYDDEGQIVTSPYSDSPTTIDDQAGRTFLFELTDDGGTQSITAANGLTVRVIEPTGEYDPEVEYLTNPDIPAKLEVLDTNGEVAWTTEAGGSAAVWLSLIDFNGRHVMFARAPTEPADPALQHVVYDLNCPYANEDPPQGEACTRTFWTQFGKATLVGPDLPPGEADLNPQLLDICPTSLTNIQPPLEMTEDWFGPQIFSEAGAEGFEAAASALKTCDPLGLSMFADIDGLSYEAGTERDGWMWTELARALDGPFDVPSDANTKAVWQRYDGGVAIRLEQPDGYMMIDPPAARPPGNVAVVRTEDHVVVSGDIGRGSVPVILAAVNDLADEAELEVVDYLVGTSAVDADDPVSDFTAAIGRELNEAGREVHLAYGEVLVSPSAEGYSPELTEIAFAFSDFADGGDGTFDELPLADEVALALGSEVVARRGRDDLVERNAWTVNDSEFRAYSGPFDILSEAGGPVVVGSGVHPHCASPLPTPAPPELAQFQRVWLQPPEDSIDSCLSWSSVDLFVDDTGRIRGVSLDLWEP